LSNQTTVWLLVLGTGDADTIAILAGARGTNRSKSYFTFA